MRINGGYLLNLVKLLDAESTLNIDLPKSNQKPMLFKATPHEGETVDYIIMPLRIS
jgi:hypothetical protein